MNASGATKHEIIIDPELRAIIPPLTDAVATGERAESVG